MKGELSINTSKRAGVGESQYGLDRERSLQSFITEPSKL